VFGVDFWTDHGELESNPTCLVSRITGHVPYRDFTWTVSALITHVSGFGE
jgi:hypothetical protein